MKMTFRSSYLKVDGSPRKPHQEKRMVKAVKETRAQDVQAFFVTKKTPIKALEGSVLHIYTYPVLRNKIPLYFQQGFLLLVFFLGKNHAIPFSKKKGEKR